MSEIHCWAILLFLLGAFFYIYLLGFFFPHTAKLKHSLNFKDTDSADDVLKMFFYGRFFVLVVYHILEALFSQGSLS